MSTACKLCPQCGGLMPEPGSHVAGRICQCSLAPAAGSVMPCPFCGSPVENGYLQVRKRPQQEGHLVNMVVCLSCAASAPMGMWNTRAPNTEIRRHE